MNELNNLNLNDPTVNGGFMSGVNLNNSSQIASIISDSTLTGEITLDDNTIITYDDKQIKAKDLFRKLDILDKIIKHHYPEELLI